MLWDQKLQYAGKTDVGLKREGNEDAFAMQICSSYREWNRLGHLFIVADGMGGHEVGELASKIAIDTIPHVFQKSKLHTTTEAIRDAYQAANHAINERGTLNSDFHRMGTTCTSLILNAHGVTIAHVGDSRAYRIRGDRIDQLTFDHTVDWELRFKRREPIADADRQRHRHMLTRSMGPDSKVKLDVEGPFPDMPGDIFILCSDGVTKYLSDSEIGAICRALAPSDACRLLIHLANWRGGVDNSTAIIVRLRRVKSSETNYEIPVAQTSAPALSQLPGLGKSLAAACLVVAILSLTLGLAPQASQLHRAVPILLGMVSLVLGIVGLVLMNVSKRLKSELETEKEVESSGQTASKDEETVYWRPYRTSLASVTPDFLEMLKASANSLFNQAKQSKWNVSATEVESHLTQGEEMMLAKRSRDSVAEYAIAIDQLMRGLPGGKRYPSGIGGKGRTDINDSSDEIKAFTGEEDSAE